MEFKRTMSEWSVGESHLRWGAVLLFIQQLKKIR